MLIKRISLILLVFNIMEHSHDFGQKNFSHFKCLQGLGKTFQMVNQNLIVSC